MNKPVDRNLQEDMVAFLEHCVLVASDGSGITDGYEIRRSLQHVADAFSPDLRTDASMVYDMEADEIRVETRQAIYYISVLAVYR